MQKQSLTDFKHVGFSASRSVVAPLREIWGENELCMHSIKTLNIAGPRESKRPGGYQVSCLFLDQLICRLQGKAAEGVESVGWKTASWIRR